MHWHWSCGFSHGQRGVAVRVAVLGGLLSACSPSAASETAKLEATLSFVRARNVEEYAITGPNVIDEATFVLLGGSEQWITIRGEDRANPVLLFLHGGPGDATNPWAYATFRPWLQHFTIVQWDQRGAGRTLRKNGTASAKTVSVPRMVQDGTELASYLCKALGKDKVVIVGHSWGSMLGVLMAKARPDLFHAFVGTGQVVAPTRSYAVAHAELVRKAQTLGNERALRELREVGQPPYSDGKGYAVQRRWSNAFEGADVFIASTLGLALAAPGYTHRDINDWLEGQALSADRLVAETSKMDAAELGGSFEVPVFVIQGAEDFTTPTALARSFVESIDAPDKGFHALEGAGHFAVFMQRDAFLVQLLARVLPIVNGSNPRTRARL